MLLAGGTMGGESGFAAGLATHLVPMDELESATTAFAERLAKGAEISAELIQTEDAQARLRTLFKR